jgi:hypothetical protein
MALGVDLKSAEHGDVDMAAPDQREGYRAVESRSTGQRADRSSAGIGQ